MAFSSGTAEVGEEDPVRVCAAGTSGVRVRNNGGTRVFLGGPDVTADGYPLEPGASEVFYGGRQKQSPVVPAPDSDAVPDTLYALTAPGTGVSRVAWIGT